MDMIETTITEHIFNQGLAKGKAEGEVPGQIKMLDMFYQPGLVTEEQFQQMERPPAQTIG